VSLVTDGVTRAGGVRRRRAGDRSTVFLFFSNRLGCVGSLALSLAVTLVLVLLLWR
jgi:hypothetical protein